MSWKGNLSDRGVSCGFDIGIPSSCDQRDKVHQKCHLRDCYSWYGLPVQLIDFLLLDCFGELLPFFHFQIVNSLPLHFPEKATQAPFLNLTSFDFDHNFQQFCS